MTDIMSRSGGVGINLSALPPKGTPIAADGRGTNGAVRPTVALEPGATPTWSACWTRKTDPTWRTSTWP